MELMPFDLILPAEKQWSLLRNQAMALLQSRLLPKSVDTAEKVIVIILKGRELGIPPMQALEHIHVINGKPCMSAELMLSQILKKVPQTKLKFVERSDSMCKIEVTRPGMDPNTFQWTIEDASKAGLLRKDSWRTYPRAMLHARVISEMARSLFPDCNAGISYTPEELGAEVDSEGSVIDVTPSLAIEEIKPEPKLENQPENPMPDATPDERWAKAVEYAGRYGIPESDLLCFVGNAKAYDIDEMGWEALRAFVKDRVDDMKKRNESKKSELNS